MSHHLTVATPAQRIERLNNLKRVMLDVQVRHEREIAKGHRSPLDMSYWGEKLDPATDPTAPSCGTQACAAGWAGLDPWFISQGLESKADNSGWLDMYFNGAEADDTFEGLAAFFGITEDEAFDLFDPYRYVDENDEEISDTDISPQMVIDRIDTMLLTYQAAVA